MEARWIEASHDSSDIRLKSVELLDDPDDPATVLPIAACLLNCFE